jgi:magnesium-transporting ATPase (P-type)
MSVLCKMPDGRFRVICKGTGTVPFPLLRCVRLCVCAPHAMVTCMGGGGLCLCVGEGAAGADNVVLARLADGQTELKTKTEDHLLSFSREGLRTLCYAHRELEADFVVRWVQAAEEGVCVCVCAGTQTVAGMSDTTLLGQHTCWCPFTGTCSWLNCTAMPSRSSSCSVRSPLALSPL